MTTDPLVQGARQLEAKYSFEADYPKLPSDLLPGIEAETVILYDAVDPNEPIRFVWDSARTMNFRLDFKPYEWTIGP